ncbi:MAG: AraC family transcriptional regulator, partial [Cytophagales bacterium]|nr:AraC family transcriptional regulator [Cytophagales bacterium]
LTQLGYSVKEIQLGRVILETQISLQDRQKIKDALLRNGFDLLDDGRSKIIEKIKILIIDGIWNGTFCNMNINLSQYISEHLHLEYTYLSNLFSSVEGKSIERYMILQKMERIKELITYDEMNIKQIADLLGYSSLQALSNQFKKEIGITPSAFKSLRQPETRKPISEL